MAGVDTFALSDADLRKRWASVILAFVFASVGFELPADWFSLELKPKESEKTNFSLFHERLHKAVMRMPESTFRTNVLGCLKVYAHLALDLVRLSLYIYFRSQLYISLASF